MIRCKDMGGWGDTNDDDCDDGQDKINKLSTQEKQSRYVSQFASKVRHDADQCKTACWSSMGLPTTELDGPSCYLRKFSRQLPSHVSLSDFLAAGDPKNQRRRSSVHQKSVVAPPPREKILPNLAAAACHNHGQCNKLDYSYLLSLHNNNHQNNGRKNRRITPLLVRNMRRRSNFPANNLHLPPIIINDDKKCQNNNCDHHHLPPNDNYNNKKNLDNLTISDRRLLELACAAAAAAANNSNKIIKKDMPPFSLNLKDDQIDKRNIKSSIPHLLNPNLVQSTIVPDQQMMMSCSKQNNDLIKYLKTVTSPSPPPPVSVDTKKVEEQMNRDICDNFIIQKLLELRGLSQPNLSEKSDTSSAAQEKSDCYNGKVDYIERGEKNFIFENALKCARMPAKISQNKIIDDHRMVFKQDYGQVPEYIKRRKEQLENEKQVLTQVMEAEANRRCRQLTENERTEIINGLNRNWEDLFFEFQKLPLFSSSPRVKKRKAEIESKLRDLEADLRLMSRHGRLFVSAGDTESPFLWQ